MTLANLTCSTQFSGHTKTQVSQNKLIQVLGSSTSPSFASGASASGVGLRASYPSREAVKLNSPARARMKSPRTRAMETRV